jgi:excinuclease ABC subunit C
MEFERAASLRDKLFRLEALKEQFLHFRCAVETLSFVYTVPGYDHDDRVYLIRRGRVRAERKAPRRKSEREQLARLASDVYGQAERDTSQVPTHEIDELLLLTAWFNKFPAELTRTQPVADAGLRRVTGSAPASPHPATFDLTAR